MGVADGVGEGVTVVVGVTGEGVGVGGGAGSIIGVSVGTVDGTSVGVAEGARSRRSQAAPVAAASDSATARRIVRVVDVTDGITKRAQRFVGMKSLDHQDDCAAFAWAASVQYGDLEMWVYPTTIPGSSR